MQKKHRTVLFIMTNKHRDVFLTAFLVISHMFSNNNYWAPFCQIPYHQDKIGKREKDNNVV